MLLWAGAASVRRHITKKTNPKTLQLLCFSSTLRLVVPSLSGGACYPSASLRLSGLDFPAGRGAVLLRRRFTNRLPSLLGVVSHLRSGKSPSRRLLDVQTCPPTSLKHHGRDLPLGWIGTKCRLSVTSSAEVAEQKKQNKKNLPPPHLSFHKC